MKDKRIKKPNIIFIVMDALRARNLGCYGYYRKTSPNIDNLAKQGVLFENAFSSNNETDKSFLFILSGRHILLEDESRGSITEKELNSFFNSGGRFLQKILKKNGYKTYFLEHLYGLQKIGFDYYLNEIPKKESLIRFIIKIPIISQILKYLFYNFAPWAKIRNKMRPEADSEKFTNKTIEIIKQSKNNNFFLVLHYMDTHTPYKALGKFAHRFKAEKKSEKFFNILRENNYNIELIKYYATFFNKNYEIEDVIAKYDNAIAYDDYLIGKIIKTLKEERIFDDTIIVFFADHGESLNEHGIYFAHHGLYDISTHIPLMILAKEFPKNKKINALVTLQDIVPTILNLVNIDYDPFLFDGKSLLPLIYGKKKKIRDLIFMEENVDLKKLAIRTKEYKYLESASEKDAFCKACNNIHQGVIELYDLEKDPEENVNIAKKNKKVLMEMKLKLDKTIKEIKNINEKRRIKRVLSESLKTKSL